MTNEIDQCSEQYPDFSSPRKGTHEVPGAALSYVEQGRGLPLLILGSSIYYPRTFSANLCASCRLIFMDLRHFAHKLDTELVAITLETYCDDVEAMRIRLGLERFVLVGHSHHGNVALEYARRYPHRVSHLVLIGTPPCDVRCTLEAGQRYWKTNASSARKAALIRNQAQLDEAALAELPPGEAFVARYVAEGPRYWYDPHFDAAPLWRGVPIDTCAFMAFRDFFVDYEFSWSLEELSAAVLVVMGRHDYVVPPSLWESRLPCLPPVTYRILDRSGHTPQLEEPETFDRLLLEWLDLGQP